MILHIQQFTVFHPKTYFNWSVHVWLFNPQHNLPGDSDTVEEVVDETHIVDECVHVTSAQHQKCGDTLHER